MQKAIIARDFERMARVLLPLQEARRQIRDQAIDENRVQIIAGELPTGRQLTAGCYLVAPPRVGVDGRALREAADRKHVSTVVLVREPTSRDGLWPLVAIGPVTVRTKVRPPLTSWSPEVAQEAGAKKPAKGRAGAKKTLEAAASARAALAPVMSPGAADLLVPSPSWFAEAAEALGDAAIASLPEKQSTITRVDALYQRLCTIPDHEKLHQRLADACRDAARLPVEQRRTTEPTRQQPDDGDTSM
jgi:hypothetical protein